MSLDQAFAEAMGQLLGPDFPAEIALAVSGGSDSMAMLYLAHNWTRIWGVRLRVFTVDHGFRPEAREEAAMVARECAALGWPHQTLAWRWDGRGNKMAMARMARLRLIAEAAHPVRHILMAHTRDDLAETFLMRLKRGSGVDGLAAMAQSRVFQGLQGSACLLRPCLGMRRAELRHYLKVLHGPWREDPSNEDPAFDRARIRAALPQLEALGLSVDRLAETALAQARARQALWARAASVWREIGREGQVRGQPTGDILLDRDGFARIETETQLRLLAAALCYVSGTAHRPRLEPLTEVLQTALAGGSATLHGCEIIAERAQIRILREFAALTGDDGGLWDGRWRLTGGADATLTALGDPGWQSLPDALRQGVAYKVARVLPSIADSARSPLDGDGFEFCPMGQPGLTFDAFLASH